MGCGSSKILDSELEIFRSHIESLKQENGSNKLPDLILSFKKILTFSKRNQTLLLVHDGLSPVLKWALDPPISGDNSIRAQGLCLEIISVITTDKATHEPVWKSQEVQSSFEPFMKLVGDTSKLPFVRFILMIINALLAANMGNFLLTNYRGIESTGLITFACDSNQLVRKFTALILHKMIEFVSLTENSASCYGFSLVSIIGAKDCPKAIVRLLQYDNDLEARDAMVKVIAKIEDKEALFAPRNMMNELESFGLMKAFSYMVDVLSNDECLANSLQALASIFVDRPLMKSSFVQVGGILKLSLRHYFKQDLKVKIAVVRAMANLVFGVEDIAVKVASDSTIVRRLLNSDLEIKAASHDVLRRNAYRLLANLFSIEKVSPIIFKRAILPEKVYKRLSEGLIDDDVEARRWSTKALAKMLEYHEISKPLIITKEPTVFASLINNLFSSDSLTVLFAVLSISNLCRNQLLNKELMSEMGIMDKLLPMLIDLGEVDNKTHALYTNLTCAVSIMISTCEKNRMVFLTPTYISKLLPTLASSLLFKGEDATTITANVFTIFDHIKSSDKLTKDHRKIILQGIRKRLLEKCSNEMILEINVLKSFRELFMFGSEFDAALLSFPMKDVIQEFIAILIAMKTSKDIDDYECNQFIVVIKSLCERSSSFATTFALENALIALRNVKRRQNTETIEAIEKIIAPYQEAIKQVKQRQEEEQRESEKKKEQQLLLRERLQQQQKQQQQQQQMKEKHSAQAKKPSSIDIPPELRGLTVIPSNEIEFGRELGRGSFGIVRESNWNGVKVAIKLILSSSNLPHEAIEEFRNEVVAHGSLRHPNVVLLYGVMIDPILHQYGLVMEYMERGSLADYLRKDKTVTIPWNQKLQLAKHCISGLAYLHSRNIIHRDLKAMNCLVDNKLTVKLSDFGLSKVKAHSASTGGSTGGGPVGTLLWMAPELFESDTAKCTYATDIYALGMVLWEIASRKLPYESIGNMGAIIKKVLTGGREVIPSDCPSSLKQMIEKCWSQESSQRPTCEELILLLKDL